MQSFNQVLRVYIIFVFSLTCHILQCVLLHLHQVMERWPQLSSPSDHETFYATQSFNDGFEKSGGYAYGRNLCKEYENWSESIMCTQIKGNKSFKV